MVFRDRNQAARLLVEHLAKQLDKLPENPVVLGIPRGGVPLARVVAEGLDGELDILLVHKITFPDFPEFAVGAVSEDGEVRLGRGAEELRLRMEDADQKLLELASLEISRLHAKRKLFSPGRGARNYKDRCVILVDDGIATGETMAVAVRTVLDKGAARVIVATPVASDHAVRRLEQEGAEVCSVIVPDVFFAVSQFYEDFKQVEDTEVVQTLSGREPEILIRENGVTLKGYLHVPESPKGIVIFAHGSGSGRKSPRNQYVARVLFEAGIATLLADLLDEVEAEDRTYVFDLEFLARRLDLLREWVEEDPQLSKLPCGLFGASTGAAAALMSAARRPRDVAAVVSRGGRPDLAGEDIGRVEAPTLLIVGGNDLEVIKLNRLALRDLDCEKELEIVPEASHLFEEPGALEQVAELAKRWFEPRFVSVAAERQLETGQAGFDGRRPTRRE